MSPTGVEPLTWRAYAVVGALWFLVLQTLSWVGVEASAAHLGVSSLAFLAIGGLCWSNGRTCGTLHCRISGPGYVAIGLVAAIAATGAFTVDLGWLVVAFLVVAGISLLIEMTLETAGPEGA